MNSEQKETLMARLASVDISGLKLDRIQARTLVQYAGSLVGRDFRTVLHVAPSVLVQLVSDKSYTAWLALCELSAFVYRPVIDGLELYIVRLSANLPALLTGFQCRLEIAIDRFLEATALWNIQWFNKPKFHVILHLPRHIRRIGPAPLCATETFEAFNHVIRLRSIHSNRHAPSSDIADAFSHLHAVRHLLSGGSFPGGDALDAPYRQAGRRVLQLAKDRKLRSFMGMEGLYMDRSPGARSSSTLNPGH